MRWRLQYLRQQESVNFDESFELTLHISQALLQDQLQLFWVLELLANLANDALREFSLLTLLHLSFVANPGIKDRLGLLHESSPLFEFVRFGLEMSRLLDAM